MFTERSIKSHSYLWIAAIVLLILFFGYVYWYEHKEGIDDNFWPSKFENEGLTREQIRDITHDDGMWYYQKVATCVGYGENHLLEGENHLQEGENHLLEGECPMHETFCAGGNTYGTPEEQAKEVALAIKRGGVHEFCPLIYSGTD